MSSHLRKMIEEREESLDITDTQKAILLVIADFFEQMALHPSVTDISKLTGLSHDEVKDALHRLLRKKLIKKFIQNIPSPNLYKINTHALEGETI
jgi:DNA-binding MarR family transcriptional regulator